MSPQLERSTDNHPAQSGRGLGLETSLPEVDQDLIGVEEPISASPDWRHEFPELFESRLGRLKRWQLEEASELAKDFIYKECRARKISPWLPPALQRIAMVRAYRAQPAGFWSQIMYGFLARPVTKQTSTDQPDKPSLLTVDPFIFRQGEVLAKSPESAAALQNIMFEEIDEVFEAKEWLNKKGISDALLDNALIELLLWTAVESPIARKLNELSKSADRARIVTPHLYGPNGLLIRLAKNSPFGSRDFVHLTRPWLSGESEPLYYPRTQKMLGLALRAQCLIFLGEAGKAGQRFKQEEEPQELDRQTALNIAKSSKYLSEAVVRAGVKPLDNSPELEQAVIDSLLFTTWHLSPIAFVEAAACHPNDFNKALTTADRRSTEAGLDAELDATAGEKLQQSGALTLGLAEIFGVPPADKTGDPDLYAVMGLFDNLALRLGLENRGVVDEMVRLMSRLVQRQVPMAPLLSAFPDTDYGLKAKADVINNLIHQARVLIGPALDGEGNPLIQATAILTAAAVLVDRSEKFGGGEVENAKDFEIKARGRKTLTQLLVSILLPGSQAPEQVKAAARLAIRRFVTVWPEQANVEFARHLIVEGQANKGALYDHPSFLELMTQLVRRRYNDRPLEDSEFHVPEYGVYAIAPVIIKLLAQELIPEDLSEKQAKKLQEQAVFWLSLLWFHPEPADKVLSFYEQVGILTEAADGLGRQTRECADNISLTPPPPQLPQPGEARQQKLLSGPGSHSFKQRTTSPRQPESQTGQQLKIPDHDEFFYAFLRWTITHGREEDINTVLSVLHEGMAHAVARMVGVVTQRHSDEKHAALFEVTALASVVEQIRAAAKQIPLMITASKALAEAGMQRLLLDGRVDEDTIETVVENAEAAIPESLVATLQQIQDSLQDDVMARVHRPKADTASIREAATVFKSVLTKLTSLAKAVVGTPDAVLAGRGVEAVGMGLSSVPGVLAGAGQRIAESEAANNLEKAIEAAGLGVTQLDQAIQGPLKRLGLEQAYNTIVQASSALDAALIKYQTEAADLAVTANIGPLFEKALGLDKDAKTLSMNLAQQRIISEGEMIEMVQNQGHSVRTLAAGAILTAERQLLHIFSLMGRTLMLSAEQTVELTQLYNTVTERLRFVRRGLATLTHRDVWEENIARFNLEELLKTAGVNLDDMVDRITSTEPGVSDAVFSSVNQ